MSEPKCPECAITGIEHIISKESAEKSRNREPWFLIVHCNACGYVYNVLSKHVFSQTRTPKFKLPGIKR